MPQDKPWYETEEFWEITESVLFPPKTIEAGVDQVVNLLELTQTSPGASVLDLCCGIGRHTLPLARSGFSVTAVDLTKRYLEKAQKQAQSEGLTVDFILSDMRQHCQPEAYDLIINMFTSFGYFDKEEDDLLVATNMYQSLRPGGKVVIGTIGKERLAKIFQGSNWFELDDGTLMLQERKATRSWGWMENRWIFIKGTERHELRFGHRLYSAAELTKLMLRAGFSTAEAYGNLEGVPYEPSAERLVVVATK